MLEQLLVDASKKLPRPTDWLLQLHAYTHAHTHTHTPDIVTITTIRSKKVAISLCRMNFYGYVVDVTIFRWMLTIANCFVVELGLGLGL